MPIRVRPSARDTSGSVLSCRASLSCRRAHTANFAWMRSSTRSSRSTPSDGTCAYQSRRTKMSVGLSGTAFRPLGDASKLLDNDVNPYYLEDLKHRVSVARVGGNLFAFDDIYQGYPLSAGLLTGMTLMSQY